LARKPNENTGKAYELYKAGMKLVEIASQLSLPPGTVRRWKSIYKWDNERSVKKSERSNKSKGGQPGNKNATGPPGNKNAEKHGFFSKWLPEETMQIMGSIQGSNSLDLLWDNIQLQYAAIIRAQKIMHVKDQEDLTKVLKRQKESSGDTSESWEKEYELQFAWDKQATFLQAQSRAMKTLEGMIKQYDELLKTDLATEEQKARIEVLKSKVPNKDTVNSQEQIKSLAELIQNPQEREPIEDD
jgi:phage terminase small subunit